MTEITLVNANVLRALANFANPKDVRESMRGIFVENSPKGLVLWASDGAAVAGLRVSDRAPGEAFELHISCAEVAMLPKTKNPVVLVLAAHDTHLAVEGARISCKPADGVRMPAYRRAIPSAVNHQPAQYNTTLLGKFADLAAALGRGKQVAGWNRISQNGQGPARVHIPEHPEFVGAIAPLREHANVLPEDQSFTPDWAVT